MNDVEAVSEADAAGMYAIILKTHWTSTADRAALAAVVSGAKKVKVFGGLTLDYSIGGINLDAIDKALHMGAKEIWMPTHDARHHRTYYGLEGGISLLEEGEKTALRHDVAEAVDRIGEAGAIIGTGHVSPDEIHALGRFCQRKRYKLLVTHPEWHSTRLAPGTQVELAALGIMFERCFVSTLNFPDNTDPVAVEETVEIIRSIGARSSVVSSDLGQAENPKPVEGLQQFLDALLRAGLSRSELHAVSVDNPRALIDLDRMQA